MLAWAQQRINEPKYQRGEFETEEIHQTEFSPWWKMDSFFTLLELFQTPSRVSPCSETSAVPCWFLCCFPTNEVVFSLNLLSLWVLTQSALNVFPLEERETSSSLPINLSERVSMSLSGVSLAWTGWTVKPVWMTRRIREAPFWKED